MMIPDLVEFYSKSDDHSLSSVVNDEDDEYLDGGGSSTPTPSQCVNNDIDEKKKSKKKKKKQSSSVKKKRKITKKNSNYKISKHRKGTTTPPKIVMKFLLVTNFLILILVCPTYMTLYWLHYQLHDVYIIKLLNTVVWTTKQRQENEITYYKRECTIDDLTTTNPNDLILNDTTTSSVTTPSLAHQAKVAYKHQLKHGFTVFPNILSQPTMYKLRQHILSRKNNLTIDESIYVIENDKRYSYALDSYNVPTVKNAMKEITTNKLLSSTVSKIMGISPALIELTAITSFYGAKDQWWHDDVISDASSLQYVRSFTPAYSLFIVLQNTTKQIGATGVCPGSHVCVVNPDFCPTHGFQLVSTNDDDDDDETETQQQEYWKAGDALLMNMDSWHRGSAHVDPNGLDRVMMVTTWIPRPQQRAESRQMPKGITYSLRWDHWGLTWNDFIPKTQEAPIDDIGGTDGDGHHHHRKRLLPLLLPWLRSLGLWKPHDSVWGLDYISSCIMRMANHDNGFRHEQLYDLIERGGIQFLPKFLHGNVDEETNNDDDEKSWHEYLLQTLIKCETFAWELLMLFTGSYFILSFRRKSGCRPNDDKSNNEEVKKAIFRMAFVYGTTWVLYLYANRRLHNSAWARDIRQNRRYSSPFVETIEEPISLLNMPTTFPNRNDVLIGTRYSSEFLHMYNDWLNNHPGNVLLDKMVEGVAATFRQYPDHFCDAAVKYVHGVVKAEQGRFLLQSAAHGTWHLMPEEDAILYTESEIFYKMYPNLAMLRRSIEFVMSKYRYGVHRDTALAKKHSLPHLQKLQNKLLLQVKTVVETPTVTREVGLPRDSLSEAFLRKYVVLSPALTMAQRQVRTRNIISTAITIEPPSFGAWLKSGDLVEVRFYEDGSMPRWYLGELTKVTASHMYHVHLMDGSREVVEEVEIRPFLSYYVNETIGFFHDDLYVGGKITGFHPDEFSFDVVTSYGESFLRAHPGLIRRYR